MTSSPSPETTIPTERLSFGEWRMLARSLAIYYGNPVKFRRMQALYANFIAPGDLCFDVGAHVGNRLLAWRRIGARVVAFEPQPLCMKYLRRRFGKDSDVYLEECALGAAEEKVDLLISSHTPSVTTLSREWIAAVQQADSFAHVRWDATASVPQTTLDAQIARYGEPAFCKIDVEGYELEVLAGLSRPLKALSFEYIGAARSAAVSCLDRLAELGEYRYNWSPGEAQRLQEREWLDFASMRTCLEALTPADGSGDVYARR